MTRWKLKYRLMQVVILLQKCHDEIDKLLFRLHLCEKSFDRNLITRIKSD